MESLIGIFVNESVNRQPELLASVNFQLTKHTHPHVQINYKLTIAYVTGKLN
jgi:hypothetical protein